MLASLVGRAAADRPGRRRLHARRRPRAGSRRCWTSSSRRPAAARPAGAAPLVAVDVSFGDAEQVFHVGAASCGAYGTPAGCARPRARWGIVPLADLAAPAAALPARASRSTPSRPTSSRSSPAIVDSTARGRGALRARRAARRGAGERFAQPELARRDRAPRRRRRGAVLHAATSRRRSSRWSAERGGAARPPRTSPPTRRCRASPVAGRLPRPRRCSRTRRRPPAAPARARAGAARPRRRARRAPPSIVDAMEEAQARAHRRVRRRPRRARLPERFLASRLGSTTHISVRRRRGPRVHR